MTELRFSVQARVIAFCLSIGVAACLGFLMGKADDPPLVYMVDPTPSTTVAP